MKRIFVLVLALTLMFSLSLAVHAASITGTGSSDVAEVKVAVTGAGTMPTVYYVTLEWESLTFTYNLAEGSSVWDPENHNYSSGGSGTADWVDNDANITVTNHSNTKIGVEMSFEGGGTTKTVNNVAATLTNHTFDLATGVGRTFAEADKAATTVSVANAPSVRSEFTVGMVKIAISDK